MHTVLDFQSRLWVIRIYEGNQLGDTFVINEDAFLEPLEWMRAKGYQSSTLKQIEAMQCSQVVDVQLGTTKHRLIWVK